MLQLHNDIRYDNTSLWDQPQLHAWTALLFTSRLIQREVMSVLSRENTFFFDPRFSRLSAVPSWRLSNMISIHFTSELIFRESMPALLRENTFTLVRVFRDVRSFLPCESLT